MEENDCHFNPHSERPRFCRKQVISRVELQNKGARELCSTRGPGGSRQDAVTSGSSGKSKVNKGTRIECQIILSFISNKDKRPSQPHQSLKESHAKPPWDMGLGVGGDLSDFQNVKLCSVSSI